MRARGTRLLRGRGCGIPQPAQRRPAMPAAAAGRAAKKAKGPSRGRPAEPSDFPALIPYHAGPPEMFEV
eukprot:8247531-Lingulodinium_polyedra.AAC.1